MLSRIHKFQMDVSFDTIHPLYGYLQNLSSPSVRFVPITIGMLSDGMICMSLQILQHIDQLDMMNDHMLIKKKYLELKHLIDTENSLSDHLIIWNLFRDLSTHTEFHQVLCRRLISRKPDDDTISLFLVNMIDIDQFNLIDSKNTTIGWAILFRKYIMDEYASHSNLLIANKTHMTIYDPDINHDMCFIENIESFAHTVGLEFNPTNQICPIQSATDDTYCIFHTIMMIEHIIRSNPLDIDQVIKMIDECETSDQSISRKDVYQKILELENRIIQWVGAKTTP